MPRPYNCETDVALRDEVSGETVTVRPRVVINATGAWVDLTNAAFGAKTRFMGGTKGSHLVVDCKQLHQALGDRMVYYQYADGRVCIVFPFMDKVIMGSTDIRTDDPDAAACDETEIEYMMETLRSVFPQVKIAREDVVFTFCGVRPLPASDGEVLANVSRGHSVRVIEPAPGREFPIYCLIGGKWTTFRAFAAQVADQVMARLGMARRCGSEHLPIGGGKDFPDDASQRPEWIVRVAQASGLPEDRVAVLLERYGTAAEAYASSAGADAERPLRTLPSYTVGEIRRIAAGEYVEHLSDLVYRRSIIGLVGDAREDVLRELAVVVGGVLGWDAARMASEITAARAAAVPAQ